MKKYYRIAGLVTTMEPFADSEWISRPYQIEPQESIDFQIDTEWRLLKEKYPNATDSACYLFVSGKSFYQNLIDYDGMMFHSSAVVMDGKAYLFSAEPGTGKSTHTSLWRRVFGDDKARILNDDKPAIRYENGVWYAYGTPWSGKTTQNLNLKVPIGGIAFIERGEKNEIVKYEGKDLVCRVLSQTNRPQTPDRTAKLLSHIDCLIEKVPFWKLRCNMEPEAAILSYQVMSGKEI